MKISDLKKYLPVLVALFLIAGFLSASAQPPMGKKGMKRYEKIKKKKLLEHLDLESEAEKKFLKVYDEWDKKVMDKKDELDKASIILKNRIEEEAESSVLKEKTNTLLKLQREFMEIMFKKHEAVRTVLPDDKYAIYVMFEHSFHKELQRMIFEHARKRRRPGMRE